LQLAFLTATENYFPDRAVKAALGNEHAALGHYEKLKHDKPGWRKSDNWKIARQLESAEIHDTDLGQFLKNL